MPNKMRPNAVMKMLTTVIRHSPAFDNVGNAGSRSADRFLEWTGANHLRHTKFVGLREDKERRKVVRET